MVTSKKRKSKGDLKAVAPIDGEANIFENPEAALEDGSDAQLRTISSNDVELPAGEEAERDERAEELRDRLKKIFTSRAGENFEVARDLAYLANNRSYQAWGYNTFETFVDKEFNLSKRNAEYHVKTHNYIDSALRSLLVDDHAAYNRLVDAIHAAGWTKARTLANEKAVTVENVDDVVSKIETLSTRDFEAYCQVLRKEKSDGDDDDNPEKLVTLNYRCTHAQRDDIRRAIDHAGAKMPKEASPSSKLSNLCRDYLSTNIAAEGKGRIESLIEDFVRNEGLYGVEIVVRDLETKKIIHGAHHLEAWANDADEAAS